jgi:hypothetical protein
MGEHSDLLMFCIVLFVCVANGIGSLFVSAKQIARKWCKGGRRVGWLWYCVFLLLYVFLFFFGFHCVAF